MNQAFSGDDSTAAKTEREHRSLTCGCHERLAVAMQMQNPRKKVTLARVDVENALSGLPFCHTHDDGESVGDSA